MTAPETDLAGIVRSVDGVLQLYREHFTIAPTAAVVERLPAMNTVSDDRPIVAVSLRVSDTHPAADTCRQVFEAVDAFLRAHGAPAYQVRVQISRIG